MSFEFLSIELFQSSMVFIMEKLLSVVSDLDTFHRDLGLGRGGAAFFWQRRAKGNFTNLLLELGIYPKEDSKRLSGICAYRPAVHKDMFM